jgi:hypothetical protein
LNTKVLLQQQRKCIQNELRLQLFVYQVVLKIINLEGLTKSKGVHHQVGMLEINITTWPTL